MRMSFLHAEITKEPPSRIAAATSAVSDPHLIYLIDLFIDQVPISLTERTGEGHLLLT